MTDAERRRIIALRNAGDGYKKIARAMNLSENTVKSFCRRNKIGGVAVRASGSKSLCHYCGRPVVQKPGRKQKKFCSDQCRMGWWNSHLDQVNKKANYKFVCPVCKKPFTVYGNANRKYCSHECYIEDRFGGGRQ